MTEIRVRRHATDGLNPVREANPFPVSIERTVHDPAFGGAPVVADYFWRLALEGRLFLASDADQNDLITGQTSFANTTPSILLSVPVGTVALPVFLNLSQTGSVAGGAIDVIIEIDDEDRWSTGGTSETVYNPRTVQRRDPRCTLRTGATAAAGYGVRLWGATIGQDVSPAEGAVQGPFWKPEMPYLLEGPASWLIYTYAGTTGPTWFWTVGWAEWDSKELA